MRVVQNAIVRLEGVHHVTLITADAPRNVDFYTGVLGLRLVKKTVNQDDPTVYHLFYADEKGSAGSDITFFEYPGARRGHAGAGWCTRSSGGSPRRRRSTSGSSGSTGEAQNLERSSGRLRFEDPEGVGSSSRSCRRTTSR